MCQDCKEVTWEISKPFIEECETTMSFLEKDCLDVWKRIVESHNEDQIATFLAQIVEWSVHQDFCSSIHPLIGQFCSTYEKILLHPEKKYVFYKLFCSFAF